MVQQQRTTDMFRTSNQQKLQDHLAILNVSSPEVLSSSCQQSTWHDFSRSVLCLGSQVAPKVRSGCGTLVVRHQTDCWAEILGFAGDSSMKFVGLSSLSSLSSEHYYEDDCLYIFKHFQIPSGYLTQLWKVTISMGKSHYKYYKWPFSIALLVMTGGQFRILAKSPKLFQTASYYLHLLTRQPPESPVQTRFKPILEGLIVIPFLAICSLMYIFVYIYIYILYFV